MYIQSYAEANKRSLQQTCYAIRGASGDGGKMYADGFERIRDCSQNELNGYSDKSASLLKRTTSRKENLRSGPHIVTGEEHRSGF